MALKATLSADAFDKLPDPIKEHYKKSEGDVAEKAYVLDAEGVEDVGGLKSALASERAARGTAETSLRETIIRYKDIDPEKARVATAKLQEIEDARLVEAGEFETLKQGLADRERAAVDAVKGEYEPKLQKTQSKLREVMIRKAIKDEALNNDPISTESLDAFVELAEKQVSMDDDLNIVIEGSTTNDLAEFVKNLSETPKFGVFFNADVAAGSGAASQKKKGPGSVPSGKKFSEANSLEKSRFISEHGMEKFKAWVAKG